MSGQRNADALARLERGVRYRIAVRHAFSRVWTSTPAIVQIVVAALLSYLLAYYLLGHESPVLAVTVVVSSLGLTRDARPRQIIEQAAGMLVGITLSETLWILAGTGAWQLTVALGATLVIARFASTSNTFVVAAAVQSAMVMIMPAPEGGVYVRSVDGLVGGIVAIVVTALIPRDPSSAARRDGRLLYSAIGEALSSAIDALRHADEAAATLGLERLRRTQAQVDNWTVSLDSAVAVARISPFLRRHLPVLRRQERLLHGADLTARHLRLIVRRITFLVRDREPRPKLGALMEETAQGIGCLAAAIEDGAELDRARGILSTVAEQLDPDALLPESSMAETMLVLMLRPLLVDLLVASGMPATDAQALLPGV
ncbi:FUSC family protein [Diaminobutyricimonas sp. TR449]|uniref:FUSC family protein n=1 Tax=Diaminobutyricimonas sp. TR449 TaxID=2708076 RepID=UPI00141FB2A7|nr:FUSC family protein [Diaminobutyricimonas sp. TR449]